ncbi:hypothetical protein [uncultured Polaribacter sp.]|uniref:hypothetical protein n=1 Tax=uncultured Polaribacter sp. TaxID=174711 RepID=UPI002615AC67|nr:hypothetical protein [uncultured Polaribacter sp.]
MRNYLFLLILFVVSTINGQQQPELPKYNAKNAAKLFYYNLTEAPEKIKVKKKALKSKTVAALRNYNNKIKKISFLNTPKLTELEVTINTLGKQLYSDRDLAENIKERVEKLILPLRDSVNSYETTLNDTLQTFLSKKQFKKWLKYQKAEKRKLLPQRPKRPNQGTAPPSNIGRGGRGLGGRGRGF